MSKQTWFFAILAGLAIGVLLILIHRRSPDIGQFTLFFYFLLAVVGLFVLFIPAAPYLATLIMLPAKPHLTPIPLDDLDEQVHRRLHEYNQLGLILIGTAYRINTQPTTTTLLSLLDESRRVCLKISAQTPPGKKSLEVECSASSLFEGHRGSVHTSTIAIPLPLPYTNLAQHLPGADGATLCAAHERAL